MSCLVELFFEIFVEGLFELIGYCYIKLMTMIVPNKAINDHTKKQIKTIATSVAAVLVIVLIIGLILLVQDEPFIKNIGKYMTYIPLALIVLQIVLGLVVRTVNHFKK